MYYTGVLRWNQLGFSCCSEAIGPESWWGDVLLGQGLSWGTCGGAGGGVGFGLGFGFGGVQGMGWVSRVHVVVASKVDVAAGECCETGEC